LLYQPKKEGLYFFLYVSKAGLKLAGSEQTVVQDCMVLFTVVVTDHTLIGSGLTMVFHDWIERQIGITDSFAFPVNSINIVLISTFCIGCVLFA